jgi:aminoglycoside phosphotransferase (APT) family kinase protein
MHLGAFENLVVSVVLHADLGADHILMENNAVSGVIDFGDANWGDPDYDFMYLFVDFGLAFVEEVARRHGHPDLARLRNKVRYFGIVDQIDTILEDEGRALDGQKEKAWLRLEQLLENA